VLRRKPPYAVLDHAARIEDLYQQVQSYRGALRHLPALEAERQSVQNQALAILRETQPDRAHSHFVEYAIASNFGANAILFNVFQRPALK
jgi:hypothetical protein